MPATKYYAVRVGRNGPKIYDSWRATEAAVRGFPYAQHKSFPTAEAAQEWLDDFVLRPPEPKLTEKEILKRLYSQCDKEKNNATSNQVECPNKRCKSSQDEHDLALALPTPQEKFNTNHVQITQGSGSSFTNTAVSAGNDSQISRAVPMGHSSSRARYYEHANLSADQARVFEHVRSGRSVFFTGSAGTGKSHLLKLMINHLKHDLHKTVFVTASTGIAASLIDGTTLHSFAGVGLAFGSVHKLISLLKASKHQDRWTSVDVLIIDEVSMIDGNFFDKLNTIAKELRNNPAPFGGIQLILTGDFFQLPPVTKNGAEEIPFMFETHAWNECISEILVLKHVFRQSDQAFVDILNEIRYGRVSERTIGVMKSLTKTVHYSDGIQPAELYPLKVEVQTANKLHLNKLDSPEVPFTSNDRPGLNFRYSPQVVREILDKNTLISEKLTLKVGAQVMLVKNIPDSKLVNGSIGVITSFIDARQLQEMDDENHPGFDYRKFENNHTGWPRVLFTNGVTKVLRPVDFDVRHVSGDVQATRVQIPLILAWALSIHKSQGQSLDRVKINLKQSFEKGQVYVALSRATSLKAIQVLGFHQSKVLAHERVVAWAEKTLQ